MKKKESKPKREVGRPTDFNDVIAKKILYCCEKGMTDKQIASAVGISEATLNNWKIGQDPQFLESIKKGKKIADDIVEASLYERACGYRGKETKLFYDNKTGQVIEHEVEKVYPPDPTAMIFWLKNRQPQRWRDKTESININLNENKHSLSKEELSGKSTEELENIFKSMLKS